MRESNLASFMHSMHSSLLNCLSDSQVYSFLSLFFFKKGEIKNFNMPIGSI